MIVVATVEVVPLANVVKQQRQVLMDEDGWGSEVKKKVA